MKKNLLQLIVLFSFLSCHNTIEKESKIIDSDKVDTSSILDASTQSLKDTVKTEMINNEELYFDSVKHLIPENYTVHRLFILDIDKNGLDEILIHCTSDKKVACDFVDDKNCYQDELLICDKNGVSMTHRFVVNQPLTNDSNHVALEIDSTGILRIKEYFRPTCCSGVNRLQLYTFNDSKFILDSLSHSVHTKAGYELYNWEYNFNFTKKTLRVKSSYVDMSSEDSHNNTYEETDSLLNIQMDERVTIDSIFRLEEILPKGIETPWY